MFNLKELNKYVFMISSQTLLKETFPCTLANLRAFEGTEGLNVQLKSQILGTLSVQV